MVESTPVEDKPKEETTQAAEGAGQATEGGAAATAADAAPAAKGVLDEVTGEMVSKK